VVKWYTDAGVSGSTGKRPELHEGQHEPIISQELFDQAQRVRAERGHGGAHSTNTGSVYLLHRVGRCWHCGRYLHMVRSAKSQGVYHCYREPSRALDSDCEAIGRHASMPTIDAQVGELIERLQLPDDWRDRLEELAGHQEERGREIARWSVGRGQYLAPDRFHTPVHVLLRSIHHSAQRALAIRGKGPQIAGGRNRT
jgi:hypothetical protein